MAFDSEIALRYLRSKRKEVFISIITVISILGVALSVMVLNIVLAVMTGFEHELKNKLLGSNAHIVVRKLGGDVKDWPLVVDEIKGIENVTAVYPYTYNQALVSASSGSKGVLVRGVSGSAVDLERLQKFLPDSKRAEDLLKDGSIEIIRPDGSVDSVRLSPIVIGKELQRKFGIAVGSAITLLSPQLRNSPHGLIPRHRRFVVTGTYSSGLVEYEEGLAYTSMEAAQSFFGLGDEVSGVEVLITDMDQAKVLAKRIVDKLTTELNGTYYAKDWMQSNIGLWEALQLEKRVYFIVLLLLVVIASFSIVSTLVMVVMEKGKDIAILKSMGASDKFVLKIFLKQGSLIGLVGTIFGTLLGVLGCVLLRKYGFEIDQTVFWVDQVPVHMIPHNFILVFFSALVITILAGIYPAKRAARLKPAEALRYE